MPHPMHAHAPAIPLATHVRQTLRKGAPALQQTFADPEDSTAYQPLRPLQTPEGDLVVALGTDADWGMYYMSEVLDAMEPLELDAPVAIARALPLPLTLPDYLVDFLSDADISTLLAHMQGSVMTEEEKRALPDLSERLLDEGYILHKTATITPIPQATPAPAPTAEPAPTEATPEPQAIPMTPPPQYVDEFEIEQVPPEELARLQIETPARRRRWPWNKMPVGTAVTIRPEDIPAASRALATYNSRYSSYVFVKTTTDAGMRVVRVA